MLHTVDPKLVIVTVGGMPIVGFSEELIDLERSEDLFNEMVGCTGETARVHINNRNATCKISLLQTSPSNDYLSTLALRDEALNVGVVPLMIKDILGTTLASSAQAYVKKMPKIDGGKSVKTREWSLYCIDVNIFVGGNLPT